MAEAARAALAEADPDVPAIVRSFDQALDRTLAGRRFNLILMALFGYGGVVLTACGGYAVSAQGVALRTRELGIRAALGASPLALVRQVMTGDMKVVLSGLAAGLVIARAAAGAAAGVMFGVSATDPSTHWLVAVLLGIVAAATCIPAGVLAGRSDPLRADRSDSRPPVGLKERGRGV